MLKSIAYRLGRLYGQLPTPARAIAAGMLLLACVWVLLPSGEPPGSETHGAVQPQSATNVYNPVAKWGAEKVASANKVMALVNQDCKVFEDSGDLVVEMHNYMDDRNTLLKYVRAIADTDVILHGKARSIFFYDPSGKKIAKADTTYGVRLEN